jgi:D-glycero-beta-D-manno-heptose 1-phosphate adenylyltransferase
MDHLQRIKTKIFPDYASFRPCIDQWKKEGKTTVFTNGCFDLVHRGHLEMLIRTAEKADKLIIGLNSDRSVQRLKGRGRPLTDEKSRALMLASFCFVDAVVLFTEDTPARLIAQILPDILVKGGDYTVPEIAGHEAVEAHGGKVEVVPLVPGYSTSLLIANIRKAGDEQS